MSRHERRKIRESLFTVKILAKQCQFSFNVTIFSTNKLLYWLPSKTCWDDLYQIKNICTLPFIAKNLKEEIRIDLKRIFSHLMNNLQNPREIRNHSLKEVDFYICGIGITSQTSFLFFTRWWKKKMRFVPLIIRCRRKPHLHTKLQWQRRGKTWI